MATKTAPTTKERIGRVGQRRQVVIPRDIFERLNMHEGDFVAFAQGREWRGRFRKRVGPYRIIFRKLHERSLVEISAILIRSKETYR